MTHKLIHHGNGGEVWATCSCERWAWLGTYHPRMNRRARIRTSHREHVGYVMAVHEDEDKPPLSISEAVRRSRGGPPTPKPRGYA